jgi:ketosteroid isomerase-like protein
MPQHAPAMVGRDAVKQAYEHVFSTLRLAIRFEVHELEVLGDQAWVRTTSAGKQTLLSSGQVSDEGNNELFVFRREGGGWRIHRYLFSTNRPPRG